VAKPIVYRHFDSKKALYMALLEKHEADLPSFIERVAPEGLPLDELVRSILDHWFDYVRENQHDWVMLFRDRSGDEEIQALRLRVNARARDVIAAFITEHAGGRIAGAQIEPLAERSRTVSQVSALWWIDNPDVSKDVPVDVGTRLVAAAL
jgi:AcrR family transcriptional regulator